MEKYYIHLLGTGQKNGVVVIDKKFEVEYNEIGKYQSSSTRNEYIQKALDFYYPGLKSHNVTWARVITEKEKKEKKSADLEKVIAGAVVGYVAGKSKNKKTSVSDESKNEVKIEKESKKLPYSFSNRLEIFNGLSFENCDEERTKTNLKYIYNHISEYNWESTENDVDGIIVENNRSLNLCVGKYEEGLNKLKSISNNPNEIAYFTKLYDELIKKREANKPWSTKKKIIVIGLIFLLALFLMAIS